jgi:hypothetical protein
MTGIIGHKTAPSPSGLSTFPLFKALNFHMYCTGLNDVEMEPRLRNKT